jgi:hypothetical protein
MENQNSSTDTNVIPLVNTTVETPKAEVEKPAAKKATKAKATKKPAAKKTVKAPKAKTEKAPSKRIAGVKAQGQVAKDAFKQIVAVCKEKSTKEQPYRPADFVRDAIYAKLHFKAE